MNGNKIIFMIIIITVIIISDISSQKEKILDDKAEYLNYFIIEKSESNSRTNYNILHNCDNFLIENSFEINELVDSVIVTGRDRSLNKFDYTHDSNGNKILELSSYWNGNNWIKNEQRNYKSGSYGNLIEYHYGLWNDNIWNSDYRRKYIYDSNGNMRIESFEELVDSLWVNYSRKEFTYDSNNNRTSELSSEKRGDSWDGRNRITYNYDVNNNLITEFHEFGLLGNWYNDDKYTYTYNDYNKLIESSHGKWDDTSWVNAKSYNEYDSNGKLLFSLNGCVKIIIDSNYRSSMIAVDSCSKIIYNYDLNRNLASELIQRNINGTLKNEFRNNYTYDSNGNIKLFSRESWIDEKWEFGEHGEDYIFTDSYGNYYAFHGVKVELFYKITTDISKPKKLISSYLLYQNYPNPFNPTTTISFSLPEASHITLGIYDILGRNLKTLINKNIVRGKHNIEFDASNFESGIYFYRLNGDGFSITKKLILLK